MGTPSAQTLVDMGVREIFRELEEVLMTMLGGLDVHRQQITFDYVDGATKVSLNGAAKGSIAGDAFNKALLNAWLGDNAVQSDLKKAMLGG